MNRPLIVVSTLVLTVIATTFIGCRADRKPPLPATGGILTPLAETGADSAGVRNETDQISETAVLPLVNPGADYNILALWDGNLDLEPSDEQALVVMPVGRPDAPLELMVATSNPFSNQYSVVWSTSLMTQALTGITLRAEDLTGNTRRDILVSGFDESGQHVLEVYVVSKTGAIRDFRKGFAITVDGNVDIITQDRSPGYYSGLSPGVPFRIAVQKKDPASRTGLDVVETDWFWDQTAFRYVQGETRYIQGDRILEERIGRVYSGNKDVYEDFLKGAWYRETGSESVTDILYFDPVAREIVFFDGSIQEVFIWGESHRTTAKRLYSRVYNSVIPSMLDTVSVSAESWDQIELSRTAANWNGIYRRLGPSLQEVLDRQTALPSPLSDLALTGVWTSTGGMEIIFDLPNVDWVDGGVVRRGTASLFSIDDEMVLQVQFMKSNGSIEETVNWKAEYSEDRDDTRVIRSIALTPVELKVDRIRAVGSIWRRFEQIEILSAAE